VLSKVVEQRRGSWEVCEVDIGDFAGRSECCNFRAESLTERGRKSVFLRRLQPVDVWSARFHDQRRLERRDDIREYLGLQGVSCERR
jgi:hypothetical protein